MRQVTVKQNVTVEIPEGYILIPDRFSQWRLYFQDERFHDGYVRLHVMLDGPVPDRIGPYVIERKEMGGASYILEDALEGD